MFFAEGDERLLVPRRGTIDQDSAVRSNYTRTIRDLNSIEVDLEKYRLRAIRQLLECTIVPVRDHASGLQLVTAVLKIDLLDEELWSLGDEAIVDDTDFRALETVRRKLMVVFINSKVRPIRELHEFTWHDTNHRIRYEKMAYRGYMMILRMQALNHSQQIRMLNLSFDSCAPCRELEAEDVIPDELRSQRVTEIIAIDLRTCFIQLEMRSKELKLVYDDRLGGCTVRNLLCYADLLLMGAARLVGQTHPAKEFTGLAEDYAIKVDDVHYMASEIMNEEIMWTVFPFVRELHRQRSTFKRIGQSLPFTSEDAKLVDTYFCNYSQQRDLVHPMHDMKKLFPKLVIAPSEPRRYTRTQRIAVMDDWAIIAECRGFERKAALIDHLTKTPWEFLRKKLQPRNIRDALLAFIVNAYINNRSQRLNFVSTFVVFHSVLEIQESPLDFLDSKRRPLIVQTYNHFNFYHKGELFVYNRFSLALLHWIRVLINEPYNGLYDGIDIEPILSQFPHSKLSVSLRD
jgi:hypothetical protein